jgi:hypothetical protein
MVAKDESILEIDKVLPNRKLIPYEYRNPLNIIKAKEVIHNISLFFKLFHLSNTNASIPNRK